MVDEPDPRATLAADAALSDEDRAEIDRRLDRLDRASSHGPWTRDTLRLIERMPAIRAGDLADEVGRERLPFKTDVRKLKNLGLTISLGVGYELSPRGQAYLDGVETDQTSRAMARASAGERPARPTSQHATGAAVRSDAWAATPGEVEQQR